MRNPARSADELRSRLATQRTAIDTHKREIRRHREALSVAAEELQALLHDSRRLGTPVGLLSIVPEA